MINNVINGNLYDYKNDINYLLKNPIKYIKTFISSANIIDYNSYYTEKSNIHFNENSLFSKHFPELYSIILNFEPKYSDVLTEYFNKFISIKVDDFNVNESNIHFESIYSKFYDNKEPVKLAYSLILNISKNAMLNTSLNKEWSNLQFVNNMVTGAHIIATLILVNIEIELLNKNSLLITDYDHNILLWTMLFHDICKYIKINKNTLEDFSGKIYYADSTHPFKSAAIAFKYFYENGFIKDCNSNNISNSIQKDLKSIVYDTYDLIIKSVELSHCDKDNNKTFYKHSFKYIDEIMLNFNYIRNIDKENNWIIDVVFLVMTHQSLNNNYKKNIDPAFSDNQIIKFYDIRMIELSLILFINDSLSYSFFDRNMFVIYINKMHLKYRKLILDYRNNKLL